MTSVGRRTLLAKTCLICGMLKMAADFALMAGGYRDSYCRVCHNAYTTPTMKNHQEETLKAALKHRQPWTEAEVQRLEQMVSEGLTGPQIAHILNRTVYAVYTMKNRLKES